MPTKKTQRGVNERSARKIRRENVILRLEGQLKSGTKPLQVKALRNMADDEASAAISANNVLLSERDVKRIKKELEVLHSRV